MDMGAGRLPGRPDEADHLALPHPFAGLQPLGERRHVAVGGLITVVVLQLDVFAIAAFQAGDFDDAVAGCENRGAVGRGPIDAGVHLHVAEDGVAAAAKARAHDRIVDRLADQELFRALAGLVVEIDDRVVGGLETVVFLGFAADGEGSEQHLGFIGAGAFVFTGKEHVKRVAGLHLALEVDVVGVDANHVLDDGGRHLVAHRGLVDALIEPHPGSIVFIVIAGVGGFGDGVHALHVDRDVFAEIGQRRHCFDGGFIGDDHPIGLQPLSGALACGRHQNAQLLAFLQPAFAAAGAERAGDGFCFLRRGALVPQDRSDGIALLDHVNAFVGRIAAGGLFFRLRQQGDVFRHHPGFKAGIGIGDSALGGVGQFHVGLRAAGVGRRVGEGGITYTAIAAPVRCVAHPHQNLVERDHSGKLRLRQDRRKVLGDE